MKEYTSKLLDKALDTIEGAEGLTNMGKAEMAAGRAYYTMFYVAKALLYNEFDLNSTSMVRSLRRTVKILQKPKLSTQNIIAGYEMDLINVFLEIME